MKNKLPNINSNTGRFIDGNPTTGTLGTIVTAEWLNGVQERVQDVFEELRNVLLLGNLQPDGQRQNQVAEAIKAYCNNINLKVQSNTRNFDNYIPNSKKSNSVTSNSADTVATSVAAKTAYDKGVEAKTAADNANNNANSRVSKTGDMMTGGLGIKSNDYSYLRTYNLDDWSTKWEAAPLADSNFASIVYLSPSNDVVNKLRLPKRNGEVAIIEEVVKKSGDTITGLLELKNGDYSSINQWNLSERQARSETLPDSNSNFFKISYRKDNGDTELHAVHFPKRGVGKNVAYEDWVDGNYIPRNGDVTIKGRHFFKNNNSWISIISTAGAESGIDFANWNGKYAQVSIRAVDVGNFADEMRFYTTPQGSNYETDRRQHTMTLGYAGDLWTKKYGWLHDFFAKQSDNNNIWNNINSILNELNNAVIKRSDLIRSWYPNHYAGTEVYKIRHLGLMLTVMNTTGANGEYTLPEAYDGHAIALAQDRGDGRVSLEGSRFLGGNKIRLTGRSDTHCHVLVIGFKNV
ncbi:hypothetical protein A6B39_00680 [Mannheimia granulomatis]|uniref:hypothetical protein n=1 Tax=Mannheimia granulomatis TaxID=85402 RepID=UPI001F2FDD8F|nr:hypothetical protein [Mannheimia granulomatis]QLB14068.1 hypothetical protein A6B39_00680 [Mannheimia granulomatis]